MREQENVRQFSKWRENRKISGNLLMIRKHEIYKISRKKKNIRGFANDEKTQNVKEKEKYQEIC